MRYVESREPRQRRAPEQERPTPTPPELLLALQRGAGNHALASRLQRTLTVSSIDWDPTSQRHTPADLPIQPVLDAFGNKFEGELDKPELQRFKQLKRQAFTGNDIPDLVRQILAYVFTHAGHRQNAQARYGQRLEEALGKASHSTAGQKERGVFMKVLEKCDPKSRAKGAPSAVAIGSLDGGMQNGINGKQMLLQGHVAALGLPASYTASPGLNPRILFSSDLNLVRSAHTNNAGWLPARAFPSTAVLDGAARTWAINTVAAGAAAGATAGAVAAAAALTAAFGVGLARLNGALGIEEMTTLPAAEKQHYYTTVHGPTLASPQAMIQHAARRYAEATFANAAYIEISAEGCGGLSRIVWDIMNDEYYVGAHYQWVEGFNPFIHVTGLGNTY